VCVAYKHVCADEVTSDRHCRRHGSAAVQCTSCSGHQLFSTPAVYRLTVNVLHNIQTEFGLTFIVLRLIKSVSK